MDYLLTFQNTHYAIHSENLLTQEKIPLSVMALPEKIGDFCGICLKVKEEYFAASRSCLNKAQVPVEAVFKITYDGNERKYQLWSP
ncbi:DUF3343 domain-containing protein [Erwinia sp. CPCC 100877]|nr:DUF3343 domain-containing protein [Erwinia sp. CPCC 100877]